jgi:hypothetical protein
MSIGTRGNYKLSFDTTQDPVSFRCTVPLKHFLSYLYLHNRRRSEKTYRQYRKSEWQ